VANGKFHQEILTPPFCANQSDFLQLHFSKSKMKFPTKAQTCVLFLLFFLEETGAAQSVNTLMGARAAGLGSSSATLCDEWAMLNNVGGLSKVNHTVATFAYDSRPALPGADRMAATFSTPLKNGVAGLGLFRFGDGLYDEQIISTGYSNQFGLASLGLKINYIQYRAEGFGTRNALSLNFGGVAQITPQIAVGAYIVNINQPRLSTVDSERLPTKLVAGVSFKPDQKILLVSEIEKDLSFNATFKAGAEYQLHNRLHFRTGFNLQPNAVFFGMGLVAKNLKIDYALQHNNALSFAHQASLICRIDNKKKKPIHQ